LRKPSPPRVGDGDLFEQPEEDQVDAATGAVERGLAGAYDLRDQVFGPVDRAGNELRKIGDEQRVIEEPIGRLDLAER
jgi:hypothetical protein